MTNRNETDEQKQKQDNEQTGGMAGAGAGALAGAQVGTVLIPIPVVGTFAGALVGGVVGSKVGKKYGGAMLDKLSGRKESPAPAENKTDVVTGIAKLAKLHKEGVLSDDEFRAAKASLLNL